MFTVSRCKERFAISGTAAVIDAQHGIAMVRQVLNLSVISPHGLTPGSAMHINNRGHLVACRSLVGLIIDGGYYQPVERSEAHHFRLHQVRRVYCLIHALGEL